MKRPSPTLERIIAGTTLAVLFLVMASVFAPDFSHAGSGGEPGPPVPGAGSVDPNAGFVSLGTIEDERYRIDVWGGGAEPLYSVYDRSDGREVGVLLRAEDVARWFPDLPLPGMEFGDGAQLMLAEPEPSDPTGW